MAKILEDVVAVDCVIDAVAHEEFKTLSLEDSSLLFWNGNNYEKILIADIESFGLL